MLRRDDLTSRRAALGRIRAWDGRLLDRRAAASVLRSVTVAYPWVRGERVDPADLLVRVLWAQPHAVDVADVEAAYHMAGERVRRSLLHLLALRRDRAGLEAVLFLVGEDGPADLLPAATSALLDPLLDLADVGHLPGVLAGVAGRTGWAWHASDLLRRLVLSGRLAGDDLDAAVGTLAPSVAELVDAVDRGVGATSAEATASDLTREDRRRLSSLVRFLESASTASASTLLLRILGSADPRAAAPAAVALCARVEPVAPDRLDLIAREPEPRALLLDGLDDLGLHGLVPAALRSGVARAEADLVRWLADETELGVAPDEIEHVGAIVLPAPGPSHPSAGGGLGEQPVARLFRFRMRSPHWSCARGWMVGAAGCYAADGTRNGVPFAHSLYRTEDELSPSAHLEAIREAVVGR